MIKITDQSNYFDIDIDNYETIDNYEIIDRGNYCILRLEFALRPDELEVITDEDHN